MKPIIPFRIRSEARRYALLVVLMALVSAAAHAQSAFDPQDPLRGGRTLVRSAEFIGLRADPALIPRFYDASGDADPSADDYPSDSSDGLGVVGPTPLPVPTGYRGANYDFAGVAADFDGDGKEELAYAYEAGDGHAYTRIVGLDDGVFVSAALGRRAVAPMGGVAFERQIRLVAGNVDADPEIELVLAHRDASGATFEYYDVTFDAVSGTFALSALVDENGDPAVNAVFGDGIDGSGCFAIGGTSAHPGRQFDVALADLDDDGVDELAYARVLDGCSQAGTQVNSRVVTLVRGAEGWITAPSGLHTHNDGSAQPTVSDVRWDGVALAVGRFVRDGDAARLAAGERIGERIVVVGQRAIWPFSSPTSHSREFASQMLEGSTAPGGALDVQIATPLQLLHAQSYTSSSVSDKRIDAEAADLDLDGKAELVVLTGNRVLVFETNPSSTSAHFPPPVQNWAYNAALGSLQTGQGRLLVADIDAGESETVAQEILVANAPLREVWIYRLFKDPATGVWSRTLIDTPGLPHEEQSPVALVAIDVDDDGLYLGAPKASLAEDVFQPMVVLNAPPVHFDQVGGVDYDVSSCFDADACEHLAVYQTVNTQDVEINASVASSWTAATEVRAGVSAEVPFVSASIEGRLRSEVGETLGYAGAQTTSITATLTQAALADDWMFGTRSHYHVVEYPIFNRAESSTLPHTDIVVVVPGQGTGPDDLAPTEIWRAGKTVRHLFPLQEHEPGNLLSYNPFQKDASSSAGVLLDLPYGNGGPTITISPGNSTDWSLEFASGNSSTLSQASAQSVEAAVDAELSTGAFGIEASLGLSVEGTYANDALNTHTITASQAGSLLLQLRDVEPDLLVGGTQTGNAWASYEVTPYAYWSFSGALVVDYAVTLPADAASGDSFWTALYGNAPDPAFSMPWRLDNAKIGLPTGGENGVRTRDVLVVREAAPAPGPVPAPETFSVIARINNYSLVDMPPNPSNPTVGGIVNFFLGDPSAGGSPIGTASFPPIPAQGEALARLAGWAAPTSLGPDSQIYALIVPIDPTEIRSENNFAWNYAHVIGPDPLPACSNGIDDDFDGLVDYPEDDGCEDAWDAYEVVPEPSFAAGLAVGLLGLTAARRRRMIAQL